MGQRDGRWPRTVWAAAALVLVLCVLGQSARAHEAKMVQIVHRHGARTHLRKEEPGVEKPEVELLDPAGYDELQQLGAAVSDEFQEHLAIDSPGQVHSISSDLERTRASASAFLAGLVLNITNVRLQAVPIYSAFGTAGQDRVIRAYKHCDELHARQTRLFQSDEFREDEEDSADWRVEAAKDIGEDTGLANFFNVFDRYLLSTKYQYNPNGEVPEISQDRLDDMSLLAGRIESTKFSPDVAQDLAGGPLLAEIVERFQTSDNGKIKLVEYSAHYPTLLSLLAAMGVELPDGESETIPPFGSAIVFTIDDHQTIEAEYWTTGGEKKLPLSLADEGSCNTGTCKLDEFRRVHDTVLQRAGAETWCRRCNNRELNVCLATRQQYAVSPVAAGFLGALVATLLLSIAFWCLYSRQKRATAMTNPQKDVEW